MDFKIGQIVTLDKKDYEITGTYKRSFVLERDGKKYKATGQMMNRIIQQNENKPNRPANPHMEKRLAWRKIFDKNARMPKTEDEHFAWLDRILTDLSPENLHCDGEISHSAAMKKKRGLNAEWKEVEKSFGRKVTEDEVYKWYRSKHA